MKSDTPTNYICKECGKTGVRLYREYQTFLEHITLRCFACALKNQNAKGSETESKHSIGWLVAAVPTEDNLTYWGYTSVPQSGIEWWERLPE